MNIGVIGVGAIGGWLAARLALGGHQVTCLARGNTLEALKAGLVVEECGQLERVFPDVSALAQGERELVVIASKAMALAGAAEVARPWIGPDTLLLPLHNGVPWWFVDGAPLQSVDPGGRIAAAIPFEQVIGGVVHASCWRRTPNHVVVAHADRLLIGKPDGGADGRVAQLAELLRSAGVPAEASETVRRDIWYKLWGNMTINPLSALTRATADRLVGDQALKPFILAAMAEAAAVGAAIGCPIAESGEKRMAVTARLGSFKTSMLQDLEAGRPLEFEALVGAPREIGRRVGIPTPNIDTLYAMIRLLDGAGRQSPETKLLSYS